MDITFSFDGRNYSVAEHAYDLSRIVLPDGRVLGVVSWLESLPPIPHGLFEVVHPFTGTPEEIASTMNGVLAKEV